MMSSCLHHMYAKSYTFLANTLDISAVHTHGANTLHITTAHTHGANLPVLFLSHTPLSFFLSSLSLSSPSLRLEAFDGGLDGGRGWW